MMLDPMQNLIEAKINVNKEVIKSQVAIARTDIVNHINEIQAKIVSLLHDRYLLLLSAIALPLY